MIVVGGIYGTNHYGNLTVINYNDSEDVTIRFINTGHETRTTSRRIESGGIRDRLFPNVYGVGIIGNEVSKVGGKHTKEYSVWREMLKRCYDPKYHDKFPTYEGCKTEDYFHFLPDFSEWARVQVGFNEVGWDFDKDILSLSSDSKMYSRENCVFVPKEINYAFLKWKDMPSKELPTGVYKFTYGYSSTTMTGSGLKVTKYSKCPEILADWYKKSKQEYLKYLAEKWKTSLDVRVYQKLINFEVL